MKRQGRMKVQITCSWRADERRKHSKTMIKNKAASESALKAQNLQGPASGRESSSRLAQPSGTEEEEKTNTKL